MIEYFKDTEMRDSGLIYNSTLQQIKQLYAVDPERAGELAISAIELILTGDMSSDDTMIGIMLEPMKKINERNVARYEVKVENTKQKKFREMKLQEIADLLNEGCRQKQIGDRLGLSQQVVSYRIGLIKNSYPELLAGYEEPVKEEEIVEDPVVYQKNFKF